MNFSTILARAEGLGYSGSQSDYESVADFFEAMDEQGTAAAVLELSLEEEWSEATQLRLALLYRTIEKLDLALSHLYQIFEANPDHRLAVEFLIWTGVESGRADLVCEVVDSYQDDRYDGLLDEVRARVGAEPENSELRFSLAWVLMHKGRVKAAVEVFLGLVDDPNPYWRLWASTMLGICYRQGDSAELDLAIYHFQNAVDLAGANPPTDYHQCYYNLAEALASQGSYREALLIALRLRTYDREYPDLTELVEHILRCQAWGDSSDGSAGRGARRPPPNRPLEGRERKDWPTD